MEQSSRPKLDISGQQTDNPVVDGWDRTTPENLKLAADWKSQIELCERRNDVWEKRGERIIKRYRDERMGGSSQISESDGPRRMNVLWSNVQVLKPSIYGREPLPVAERRFLDRDVVGRVAAQILERSLRYEITTSGFHDTLEQCVLDYLLPGRGTAWLRYKPMFGPATSLTDRGNDEISPSGDEESDPVQEDIDETSDPETDDENLSDASKQEIQEKLVSATVEVDYVHWKDFLTSKARFWKENEWVSRRVYMSREDCIDAFGKIVGKEIPLEMTPEMEPGSIGTRASRAVPEDAKKAIVYEIWHKPKRMVYFIAKGYDYLLEKPREDPLGLEGFWPCPKPLFATMTNDTLEPVADFVEYQDQALEIDNLTNRINSLIKALKVAGVYNSAEKNLARLLDEGHENKLIPVQNWAQFAEKGGIGNAISFLPIKEVGEVLMQLFEARDKIKNDLYEITGIADIMRGQADPRETASAISSKGRWGSLRLQQRQAEVARFCRDIIKMMGEIISDHYPVESLLETSGIMYDDGIGPEPPSPPVLTPPPVSPPGAAPQGGPPASIPPGSAPPGGMPGVVQHPPMPGQPHPALPMNGGMQVQPPNPMQAVLAYQQQMEQWQDKRQKLIMSAIDLLRQDKLRGFRIDIETDSTINDDAKEEKMERVEFLTSLSGFVEKAMQAAQSYPDMIPLLGKSILFTVRGFRVGRDLESTIEEFIDKAQADAKKAASMPKPPSPEQIKAQADMAMAQASIQEAQLKMQGDQQRAQAEVESQQIEAQNSQQEMQMKQQMLQMEFQLKQLEAQIKQKEMEHKLAIDQANHNQKMQLAEMELRNKNAEHASLSTARDIDIQSRSHQAKLAAEEREHKAQVEAKAREHDVQVKALAAQHAAELKAHQERLKLQEKHPGKKMPKSPDVPELPDLPSFNMNSDPDAPIPGARKAPDGHYYIQHPTTKKYLRVEKGGKKEPSELEKLQIEETKQRLKHAEDLHRITLEQAEKAKKPKKVIRDEKGKIVGLE